MRRTDVRSFADPPDLQPGQHLCCLYQNEEEHRALLTAFLRQGLQRCEKVLYFLHAHTADLVRDYLRQDGLDLAPYLARGQLAFLNTAKVYLGEGDFDPDRTIALLATETEKALAEGYPALRVTGEMTWALEKAPGAERLIEYEAKLNRFFPGSRCVALCQYDRRRFVPATLLKVLHTHPLAVVGTELYDNFYYLPPEEFLGDDILAATLCRWLKNLQEPRSSERDLAFRNRIADIFLTIPDEEMYGEVLQVLLRATKSKYGVFGYIDENGAYVVPSMTRDIWDQCQVPDKNIVFPREKWGGSIWPRAIRQQETLYSNEPSRLTPEGHILILRNITVPIVHRGEVVGLFQVANKETDYDEKDIQLAQTIADHIAPILNARLQRDREEKERKRAEKDVRRMNEELEIRVQERTAALRRSEALLAEAQRIAHLGSWEWDIVNNELFWSDEVYRIFGLTPQTFTATYEAFLNCVHPGDRELVERALEEALSQRKPYSIVYRIVLPDSSERIVHEQGEVNFDDKGRSVRTVGTVQDITERRKLGEQLRQVQKMEAVGRLAAGVAHDFNNVLGVILGYSDLLLNALGSNDTLRRKVEEIQKAGSRATSLTRQLLAFSRQQVLQPQVLDLNSVVAEMEKMLGRLIGEDIELVSKLHPALDRVKADPGQLEQILINLAVNARDAMPHGGSLTIETANVELDEAHARSHLTARPGFHVMLAVSDTGHGMDKETQSRIFEPFFTTKEKGEGTGLGLATVYGIVKQSGWWIWVYSEPGHGTTFKIYMPRVEGAVAVAEPGKVPSGTLRGWETVLLVEDAEPLRKLARELLETSGYRVLEASNGAEAIEIAERHAGPIHLLMTDVVMPKMNGREVAQRLVSFRPEAKVIYMSGYTDNALAHHGVLDAGTVLLQKPFTRDVLAHKLREVLRQQPGDEKPDS